MTRAKHWIGVLAVAGTSVWVGTAIPQGGSPAPVRLDQDKIAGLNLTAIPPDAYQEILVTGQLRDLVVNPDVLIGQIVVCVSNFDLLVEFVLRDPFLPTGGINICQGRIAAQASLPPKRKCL